MLGFNIKNMKIAIIGVGLIGGSFALALRRTHPALRVLGIDRDEAALDDALRRGVIDEAASLDAIADCDVILSPYPYVNFPTCSQKFFRIQNLPPSSPMQAAPKLM